MADINFSLTQKAAAKIAALIEDEPQKGFFRVAVNGGGCSGFSYAFDFDDKIAEDDIVVTQFGVEVLVDEASAPFLGDAQLDWVEDLIGASFKMVNPNARSSCGCGISFSV